MRSRTTGPFRSRSKSTGGVGDISLQANSRLWDQSAGVPGAVLSTGLIFPTGPSPYSVAFYQPDSTKPGYNPNPTDFAAANFARGAWGLTSNLQFYKTLDPIIVFFGGGVQSLFEKTIDRHTIQPGLIYIYNLGLSFALSEKSTLGFQVNGSYGDKLTVDRALVPESNLESAIARVSLIQRVAHNSYLEPSLIAGLTRDSPDFGLNLGFRHRF
jgi:hypothetical protein